MSFLRAALAATLLAATCSSCSKAPSTNNAAPPTKEKLSLDSTPPPVSQNVQTQPPPVSPAPFPESLPGQSQVAGLKFKATDDAALSVTNTYPDGSAIYQGNIPIDVMNTTSDKVSILLAGSGVSVGLNTGRTIDNVQVKGLKYCENTAQRLLEAATPFTLLVTEYATRENAYVRT